MGVARVSDLVICFISKESKSVNFFSFFFFFFFLRGEGKSGLPSVSNLFYKESKSKYIYIYICVLFFYPFFFFFFLGGGGGGS